ncbi:MAG: D-tyrosyl-tRNA(Tyr) deacylase [Syntrophomonadaceae bacterium]|jgi:D-tyrosyl-tRNA(Tyr) deacylase|nr:D-tyrosyl-tRNA(Tyr) deacylase [Syntrophomonadaceae bacterium]
MKAVIQRVIEGQVLIGERICAAIQQGLVVLIGVGRGDTIKDADFIADKIVNLRIFEDGAGKMNLSVSDIGGAVLAVPQFTLYGDARKGRRPNFMEAAPPESGEPLFNRVKEQMRERGIQVETGEFGAHMIVRIINDGPCTIILDSRA